MFLKKIIVKVLYTLYYYYNARPDDVPYGRAIVLLLVILWFNFTTVVRFVNRDSTLLWSSATPKYLVYLIGVPIMAILVLIVKKVIPEKEIVALEMDEQEKQDWKVGVGLYAFVSLVLSIYVIFMK